MKPGDKVCWRSVNGFSVGVLCEPAGNGDWYVTLPSGKSMLVNEKSFKEKKV